MKEDIALLEIMTNETEAAARIIVIGVGGAGNNAVKRMLGNRSAELDFMGWTREKRH